MAVSLGPLSGARMLSPTSSSPSRPFGASKEQRLQDVRVTPRGRCHRGRPWGVGSLDFDSISAVN